MTSLSAVTITINQNRLISSKNTAWFQTASCTGRSQLLTIRLYCYV